MEEKSHEKEVLELQKAILVERMNRLNAEFELAKRDMANINQALSKLEEKPLEEKSDA